MSWFETIAAGVIPVMIVLYVVTRLDYRPIAWDVLLKTFCLGMFIVAPVAFYNWFFPMASLPQFGVPWVDSLLTAFVCGAFPEEVLKFLVLYGYCSRREFKHPMDGIIYGATASLGFAAYENICYIAVSSPDAAITRAFTAVPGHACMGALMGYYYQRAVHLGHRSGGRFDFTMRGLLTALFIHTLYDFSLLMLRDARHYSSLYDGDGWEMVVWRWTATILFVGTLAASLGWTGHLIMRERRRYRSRRREAELAAESSAMDERSSIEAL